MKIITALTTQKRNLDRVNVFLDDTFAFGLSRDAAAALQVGQVLTPAEIAALQQEEEKKKAKNTAVRLIARRPRSVFEINRHLRSKGYDDSVIDQVIQHLIDLDLLNDESFTRYWIEQRETFKPRSHLALRQELNQKGIDRELIDSALESVDENAAAHRVALKKAALLKQLPEDEFKAKLNRFLNQRGFSYGIIRETTDVVWRTMREEL